MKRIHVRAAPVDAKETDVEAGLESTLAAWHESRTYIFDHPVRNTTIRWLTSLVSFLLLCSDIPRSGLGIKQLDPKGIVEPSVVQLYGPWAYPVITVHHNESDDAVARVWSYRFDTTSIAWRAMATLYNASAFTDCIMYRAPCGSNDVFPAKQAFAMMNQIADGTAMRQPPPRRPAEIRPAVVVVRSWFELFDRVHHYALSRFFNPLWRRTHQAAYYPPRLLSTPNFTVCQADITENMLCYDVWSNFNRTTSVPFFRVGHVARDLRARYITLQQQYPSHVVDLTVLTTTEDSQRNIGGVSAEFSRAFEVSSIFRVLDCDDDAQRSEPFDPSACQVLLTDDHRYEGGLFTSNVVEWYSVVALLRLLGQTYVVCRLLLLAWGCMAARHVEAAYRSKGFWSLLGATLRTLGNLPCQGVVYGSSFPVACYALAHVIDAPMAYRLVQQKFMTMDGVLMEFDFFQTCTLLAVQMRCIWLLGFCAQCVTRATTSRWWSPREGVFGIPEFSISFFSAFTIFAQFRSLEMRYTPVRTVIEMPGALKHWSALRRDHYVGAVDFRAFDGVWIDVKCFFVLISATGAITLLLWAVISAMMRAPQVRVGIMPSFTPVPYSAGRLWSTTAFTVYWNSDLFPVGLQTKQVQTKGLNWHQWVADAPRTLSSVQFFSSAPTRSAWEFVFQQFECLHARRAETNGMVALMNVYAMTDPLTFLHLRYGSGEMVCFLRHRQTKAVCCVPLSAYNEEVSGETPWHELERLRVVNTRDLPWSVLIHCG